eukprot:scaffold70136_cov31-Tisochrysis_lutea.AAC.1
MRAESTPTAAHAPTTAMGAARLRRTSSGKTAGVPAAAGAQTNEKRSEQHASDSQDRPRRPTPAVWSSVRTRAPWSVLAPSLPTSSLATSIVEGVDCLYSSRRPSEHVLGRSREKAVWSKGTTGRIGARRSPPQVAVFLPPLAIPLSLSE